MLSSFDSHLHLAHTYWQDFLHKIFIEENEQWVIDATCGNGHDTLFLAETILQKNLLGGVIGLDIQDAALQNTRTLLQKKLAIDHYDRVFLFHQSHASFPPIAYKKSISLIVYNLGYLPGGDKQFTTLAAETLKSIDEALKLIRPQGMISITCYPGHPEGQREEEGLIAYLKTLSNKLYTICYHQWVNRHASPSLILIRRRF